MIVSRPTGGFVECEGRLLRSRTVFFFFFSRQRGVYLDNLLQWTFFFFSFTATFLLIFPWYACARGLFLLLFLQTIIYRFNCNKKKKKKKKKKKRKHGPSKACTEMWKMLLEKFQPRCRVRGKKKRVFLPSSLSLFFFRFPLAILRVESFARESRSCYALDAVHLPVCLSVGLAFPFL